MRLKYDDTHSDQEFSKNDTVTHYCVETPILGPLNAYEMPTKRLLIAWKRPLSAWKGLRYAHTVRESSSHSENSWSEWVSSYLRRTVFSPYKSLIQTILMTISAMDPDLFECPVCTDIMKSPILSLDCGHSFCKQCVINFRKNRKG